MTIYILLVLLALLTFLLTDNKQSSLLTKTLLIMSILFSGLSYTNGWDWYGYNDYYYYIQNTGFYAVGEYNNFGIEYLYLIYMYLIGLSGAGFGFFVLVNSVIVNLLIFKFCKNTAINYAFLMLIFITVSYLRLELSTIRQGLAVVIVMYAYSSILNERWKYAITAFILAICLHRSAAIVILFVPFILCVNRKAIHYYIVVLAVPFILLSSSLNSIFISLLSYANSGMLSVIVNKLIIYLSMNEAAKINPQAILLLCLYLISIYFCDVKNKKQMLFLNIMACQVVISLYFTFLTQLIIMRLIYYFQIGWMYWIYILYKEYFRPQWLCLGLILILVTFKLILNFRYEADRAVFFPYYNVISSYYDESYGRSRDFILNKADEFPQG
ncbi:EpsG family protein [Lelliottia nimipressuralis]|uniref:EpsG family protein n=1 Tax=Lelliottia nimipressuralis TaxID=69220 RepID=A0ABD4K8B2_9ENTR|nr:EpsG family protein [Lelliottia nimipressuralis]MBF4178171.1 EpsG family protein [Lelliottia nimipressuralis]